MWLRSVFLHEAPAMLMGCYSLLAGLGSLGCWSARVLSDSEAGLTARLAGR